MRYRFNGISHLLAQCSGVPAILRNETEHLLLKIPILQNITLGYHNSLFPLLLQTIATVHGMFYSPTYSR